jgi:DNA-binding NtrC family response regulator
MNKRILIVDDDIYILRAHHRNLHFKYEISTTASSDEGLKIICESVPFAAVVTDYCMHKME